VRKSVSGYYTMQSRSSLGDQNLQENNQRHMHFISRLEAVCILLKLAAKDPTDTAAQSEEALRRPFERKDMSSMDDIANRFSTLEIEEFIDLEIEPSTPTPSTSTELVKSQPCCNIMFDEGEEDDEMDFAVFCLFDNLRRV